MGATQPKYTTRQVISREYYGRNDPMGRPAGPVKRNIKAPKKKAKFTPKEPDWDMKSDNELDCMVCLEVIKDSLVTECCMNIICKKCSQKLKSKCPLRCKRLTKQFGKRDGLTNRINKVKIPCDLCLSEVSPWDKEEHKDQCGVKELGERVKVSGLHNQILIRKTSESVWKCHSRKSPLEDHKDEKNDSYYECKNCKLKFCRFCVAQAKFQSGKAGIKGKKLASLGPTLFMCKKTKVITQTKAQKEISDMIEKSSFNLMKVYMELEAAPKFSRLYQTKKPAKKKVSTKTKAFKC